MIALEFDCGTEIKQKNLNATSFFERIGRTIKPRNGSICQGCGRIPFYFR